MFHVNPETGETGKCSAAKGRCPFGGMNVHFTTVEAARDSFEVSMAGSELQAVKKDGRSLRGNWADLELYRETITDTDEVFIHPQGKIVIVATEGAKTMRVFRNGSKATTSGTLDDLHNGRGSWKRIKAPAQDLPTARDYASSFANTDAPKVNSKGSVAVTHTAQEQANVAAGYPADSQLDADSPGNLQQQPSRRKYSEYTDRGSWKGASILPVNEKANPHKDMDTSEWLTAWNSKDRTTGEVKASSIEVWKSHSPTGKGFNFKLVATSGNNIAQIGSEGGFYHDQTGSSMGEKWTMCGAFKAEKGGQAIGEIPDRKMPLYTYK